jgi:hypothetical protein
LKLKNYPKLFILFLLLFAGCISDNNTIKNKIEYGFDINNFDEVINYLIKIDRKDDRYNIKTEKLKILSVSEKKYKLLKLLDQGGNFSNKWNETYYIYNQKARYLKKNKDLFVVFGGGQCVDAVYSLTNLKISTNSWIKGKSVMDSVPEPGTIIATFNAKGVYLGHAAVFKNKTFKYIEVFDQNWWMSDNKGVSIAWTRNIFCNHIITGNTGISSVNNVNNYFVVMVK